MNSQKENSNRFLRLSIVVVALVSAVLFSFALATSNQTKAFGESDSDIQQIIEKHVDWDAIKAASAQCKSNELNINITQSQTDDMGNPTGKTTDHNEYTLVPGHTYTQDPSVVVQSGSAPCELFIYIEDPIEKIEDDKTIADQITSNGWQALPEKAGLYKYSQVVNAEEKECNAQVSETFTLLQNLSQEDLEKYKDTNFTLTAYAYGTGSTSTDSTDTGKLTTQTSDFSMLDIILCFSIIALVLMILVLLSKKRSKKSEKA